MPTRSSHRRLFLRLGLAGTVCLVSACGFTLRGVTPLPPELQTLVLASAQPDGEFEREVRRALENNGVSLVESGAVYRLVLGGESISERTLSVNANARSGEFELALRVEYDLRQNGSVISGPNLLATTRVYLTDPENAVAKEEEANLIRSEMRRELAQQLLRQLQASLP